jgi:hypothetical protein
VTGGRTAPGRPRRGCTPRRRGAGRRAGGADRPQRGTPAGGRGRRRMTERLSRRHSRARRGAALAHGVKRCPCQGHLRHDEHAEPLRLPRQSATRPRTRSTNSAR